MRAVRAGSEGGSKKEQGIKTLQKLGFCRRSCVQGWDVGKGDMGATLTYMLQGRIQETVPVLKMGSEHKVIPASTKTKLDDPRHALVRKLGERGMKLIPITQDHNSQFRAVAQQVFGDQTLHGTLRALVCELIRTHSECFEAHIETLYPRSSVPRYLDSMQGNAARDILTLQAMAGLLRVELHVVVEDDKNGTNLPTGAAPIREGGGQVEYTLASHEGPGGLRYYSASTANVRKSH
jgi:hypothetical protein